MVKKCILAILTSLLIGVCANVFAERLVREPGREEGAPKPYIFPYGFTSEAMGFVVGVAGGISGLPQEQSSLFSTALLSSGGGVFNPFKPVVFICKPPCSIMIGTTIPGPRFYCRRPV